MAPDSSEDEWEEVEEMQERETENEIRPAENVEVELDLPDAVKKQRKKKEWEREAMETCVRRAAKRFQKETQINAHKVHLLCLLTIGMRLNKICNSELLKACAYSLLSTKYTETRPKDVSVMFLTRLIQTFIKKFDTKNGVENLFSHGLVRISKLESVLQRVMEKQKVAFRVDLILIFALLLRSMGLRTRLVMSLQPTSLKVLTEKQKEMLSESKKPVVGKAKSAPRKRQKQAKKSEMGIPQVDGAFDDLPQRETRSMTKKKSKNVSKSSTGSTGDGNNNKPVKTNARIPKTRTAKKPKAEMTTKKERKSVSVKIEKADYGKGVNDAELRQETTSPLSKCDKRVEETPLGKPLSQTKTKRKLRNKVKRKITEPGSDGESDSNFKPVESSSSGSDFEIPPKKASPKRRSSALCVDPVAKGTGKHSISDGNFQQNKFSDSDSDFDISEKKSARKYRRKTLQVNAASSKGGKVCSPSRRISVNKERPAEGEYYDEWLEVYSDQENRWLSIDVFRCTVNYPEVMEKYATPVVHYVVAFQNDGSVKDVTPRYSSKWLTETRKLRVGIIDKDWWKDTLSPYKTPDTYMDNKENREMQEALLAQPMPTTITAFKNHPLFGLRRHLLKYEAIYPPDIPALGLIRGEEIFPRSAIYCLHTRDKWLQEARCVKDGEKPYKMVASIWINMKLKQDMSTLSMPLFGIWQTEPYVPAVAKDGKVPRNQYGNVDLFQPGMMPIGCVQLRLTGLQKVARKLNIDIAQAITGFDSHSGYPHPTTDGYIVCKEYEEVLVAAWREDQIHAAEREKEKREQRVCAHWKLLIRGLLAKERVKRKYAAKGTTGKNDKGTAVSAESGTAWQAKRLEAAKSCSKGRGRKKKENMFPFETEAV